MDAADAEGLRHALACQGAILDQQGSLLRELRDTITAIKSCAGQAAVGSPGPTPEQQAQPLAPSPAPQHHREPRIPHLERYTVELGLCRGFIIQCTLIFEQQPSLYDTDQARIAFIVSSLGGRALEWATAVWESCWAGGLPL